MLERFISGLREAKVPDFSDLTEYTAQCIFTFASLSNFLGDPERFPNRDINRIVKEMRFLMARRGIPLVTSSWDIDELSFAIAERRGRKMPILIAPEDYLAKVKSDPIWQLGMVAAKAVLIKDFFSGMIPDPSETSNEVRLLTGAFCAETLLTLKKMAVEEGIERQPSEIEKQVLEAYPEGLKSLPPGLYQPNLVTFSSDTPND